MPCGLSAAREHLPPSLPDTSRPLRPDPTDGRGQVGPSLDATCGAKSRLSYSSPIRGPFAAPRRWRHSSALSPSTWHETNPPAACACLGKSYPPLPRLDGRTCRTRIGPSALASTDHHHNADTENPSATAGGTSSPGMPAQLRTRPRSRSDFVGIPPYPAILQVVAT